jgi:hypothetical protein
MAACHYCRRIMRDDDEYLRETRDHYHPRSRGGQDHGNIVLACYACNQVKGDMHPKLFGIVMRDIPEWWRLAQMKGPRGMNLIAAMKECGFDLDPQSNGQPYVEWWSWSGDPGRTAASVEIARFSGTGANGSALWPPMG